MQRIGIVKFTFLVLFSFSAFADEITQLLQKHPSLSASVLVKDLKSGKIIHSYNAEKLMIPASTTKLFMAYAALMHLGIDFKYKTKVYQKNNKIYLKFNGDPSLTYDNIKNLVAKIDNLKNIKAIHIDDNFFDHRYFGNGWAWDDTKFCYSAPISSIFVDNNCFSGVINSNGVLKTSRIFAKIYNNLKLKKDELCKPDLIAHVNNTYELNGCISEIDETINLKIAYQNPRLMLKEMLTYLCAQRGYKNIANISFKEAPNDAKLLYEHVSEPLSILMNKMLKESNNAYAESFFKTLGAKYLNTQGSFEAGQQAFKEIFNDLEFKIVDGSGTSRYNLISSKMFIDLLSLAHQNKKIFKSFFEALPISGVDGTLKKRLADYPNLHNIVIAKTGKMSGVSCLVGFIGEDRVFSIMLNGFVLSLSEIQKIQDDIVAIIAK